MATEAQEICGDDLAQLLHEASSAANARNVAKEIGFKDRSLFGGKKKKTQIETELTIINAAVIIHAVNLVADHAQAKTIIDEFLTQSRIYVLDKLAQKHGDFAQTYSQRLSSYYKTLQQKQPLIGLSFSFMKFLGLDPLTTVSSRNGVPGQLMFGAHLKAVLEEALAIVNKHDDNAADGTPSITPDPAEPVHPLKEFQKQIVDWPAEQAVTGLELIRAIAQGDQAEYDTLCPKLTFDQFDAVFKFVTKAELVEAPDTDDDEVDDEDLTPEEQKELDALMAEMDELDEMLDDEDSNDDEDDPESQYYQAIGEHIGSVGGADSVLLAQGTDREFCKASLQLYKAGYEHGVDFKCIACATAQAARDYKKDRATAISFLEVFTQGLNN